LRSTALLLVCFFYCLAVAADDVHHHDAHDANEKLGTVNFPTSCSKAAQKPFERGLALLYSFEYEVAEKQFKDVATVDTKCAMAYWGQAMSLFHQLWDRPSEADLKQGHELLEHARQLKPGTRRERDYIDAAAAFYSDSDTANHKKRVAEYAEAMSRLYARYPQDREAGVLYSLALLTSAPERDPRQTNERKAVAILNKLFSEQPDHPGVAHYIIHACDNPQMASLGLEAARKYAAIAPSSPHAVHMPSHIFARLGLWQEDIHSNLTAIAEADKMEVMHLHVLHHKLHSMDFLQYAYLQIGDNAKAKAVLEKALSIPREQVMADFQNYMDDMLASFPANFAIETRQWDTAMKLQPNTSNTASVQSVTWWAHAVAAGHLHDADGAVDALKHYDELLEAIRKGPRPYTADRLQPERKLMQAWVYYAQNKNDEALRQMREVADEQDTVGKGETELPAREMLADMLLELKRPAEALAEYEVALKTDPNRFNGLYGAAGAAEMAQQKEKAAGFYAQLIRNCAGSNSDRPELERARTMVAQR
jgi:tetratricopeptide (TPR) repeat protein